MKKPHRINLHNTTDTIVIKTTIISELIIFCGTEHFSFSRHPQYNAFGASTKWNKMHAAAAATQRASEHWIPKFHTIVRIIVLYSVIYNFVGAGTHSIGRGFLPSFNLLFREHTHKHIWADALIQNSGSGTARCVVTAAAVSIYSMFASHYSHLWSQKFLYSVFVSHRCVFGRGSLPLVNSNSCQSERSFGMAYVRIVCKSVHPCLSVGLIFKVVLNERTTKYSSYTHTHTLRTYTHHVYL